MLGLLTLILIKLDFFKRELTIENYERKLIEDSTASNSLVDQQQCNELLDRHLNSRPFTATTNYQQRGRLLRKRNLVSSVSKDKVEGRNRIRRKTIRHEYHNELTSSGNELQSSTYEEYRHLEEEDIDEIDEDDSVNDQCENESESDEQQTDSNETDESDEEEDEESDQSETEDEEETTTYNEEKSSTYQEEDETEQSESSSRTNDRSNIVYERRKINTTKRVIYVPSREQLDNVNNVNNINSVDRHIDSTHRQPANRYNEKLYDKSHYKKNKKYYTFYRDVNFHAPSCPLYSSRRSLVSYK